jgi:hypothetical protein
VLKNMQATLRYDEAINDGKFGYTKNEQEGKRSLDRRVINS